MHFVCGAFFQITSIHVICHAHQLTKTLGKLFEAFLVNYSSHLSLWFCVLGHTGTNQLLFKSVTFRKSTKKSMLSQLIRKNHMYSDWIISIRYHPHSPVVYFLSL